MGSLDSICEKSACWFAHEAMRREQTEDHPIVAAGFPVTASVHIPAEAKQRLQACLLHVASGTGSRGSHDQEKAQLWIQRQLGCRAATATVAHTQAVHQKQPRTLTAATPLQLTSQYTLRPRGPTCPVVWLHDRAMVAEAGGVIGWG